MRLPATLPCFVCLLAHIHCKDVFGIVGENFTFPVEIKQEIPEITWKKNKDKVAEREGQNTPTYFTPLLDRSMLKETGSLTIFNLEKNDAGAYELHYWDFTKDNYFDFVLTVLDPPSEPKISCSIRDDNLVLNCTSDFLRALNYSWKFSNNPHTYQSQDISIPIKNVGDTENATCFIAFSQMENRSAISLSQCIPDKKETALTKEEDTILLCLLPSLFFLIVFLLFLRTRGRIKFGEGISAQENSPVHDSGEHEQLFSGDSQEQHNSNRVVSEKKESVSNTFSQPVPCESEKPEADRELNKDDSALKDQQTVNNTVDQEEMTQDAEDRNGEHLNNSPSCSKEDLKPKANNGILDQRKMEEKQ